MFRTKEDKNRDFKKGIDPEESRRRRENVTSVLRKQQRDEQVARRRRLNVGVDAQQPGADGFGIEDHFETPHEPQSVFAGKSPAEQLAELPAIAQVIHQSNDIHAVLAAVTKLRELLSIRREPPIAAVIATNVIVPKLVQFLAVDDNPKLQFEAAWALTNIASGTSNDTHVVINAGAVHQFIRLLSSPHPDVRDQSVWALGNIAGDSHECRDMVLKLGAMRPLLELCNPENEVPLLRNATWTLSNLCRGKPQPPFNAVASALPVLKRLIQGRDVEVLTDALWALSYLSDDLGSSNKKIEAVIASGCIPRVVDLLMHNNPHVKTPALRTIGNVVSGDDTQTQAVLQANVLPPLLALLVDPKRTIRKEVCWALSNITAGNPDQIQAVIDANLIPPLITTLGTAEYDVQKEAAWAISNATSSGLPHQIRYMVQQGVIPPLCKLFDVRDHRVVLVAMEGIENILAVGKDDAEMNPDHVNVFANYVDECGGLDTLERLQHHNNNDIYKKVGSIIQEYFPNFEEEDVEDDDLTQYAQGAQQFSFESGNTDGNNPDAGNWGGNWNL